MKTVNNAFLRAYQRDRSTADASQTRASASNEDRQESDRSPTVEEIYSNGGWYRIDTPTEVAVQEAPPQRRSAPTNWYDPPWGERVVAEAPAEAETVDESRGHVDVDSWNVSSFVVMPGVANRGPEEIREVPIEHEPKPIRTRTTTRKNAEPIVKTAAPKTSSLKAAIAKAQASKDLTAKIVVPAEVTPPVDQESFEEETEFDSPAAAAVEPEVAETSARTMVISNGVVESNPIGEPRRRSQSSPQSMLELRSLRRRNSRPLGKSLDFSGRKFATSWIKRNVSRKSAKS